MSTGRSKQQQAQDRSVLDSMHLHNPASTPLPGGLKADPTYLAFMRGLGFTYSQAQANALKQIGDARAAYATTVQRLPEQLAQGKLNVNNALGERGLWSSGERLTDLAKEVTADQNRHADANSTLASGLSAAQTSLQSQISDLARQQADQVGGLQDRRQQQTNQDRYIGAIKAAASGGGGGGGGGGGYSISLPGPPPAAPAAAGGLPPMGPGQSFSDYYRGLSHDQQQQLNNFFGTFGKAPPQPSQQDQQNAAMRGGQKNF